MRIVDGEHFVDSTYDRVFAPGSTQKEVFEFISPAINQSLKGFNCTVFAYGQTGSGKTHTMFGGNWEENNPAPQVYYPGTIKSSVQPVRSMQGKGLIPNAISELFEQSHGKSFTFYCSFIQIYNEKLFDLLQDPRRDKALRIRENKLYGIFVEGLAEFVAESTDDCYILLSKGDRNRAVRQTRFNHHSSRSHTIFQMLIEADKANKRGALKKAKLNFCDLAGSEKYDKENMMVLEHIKELTQINKSLSALGKVIHSLGVGNSTHVPYRDSKLTRLLQDSLGVSTRTILIATISPASVYVEETISTLKFADRAKQVMVKIKKNEVSATNNQLITKLQREIQHLKTLLNLKRKGGMQELEQKIWVLTEENQKLKSLKTGFTVEEVEKLKEENKKLRLELQQAGLNTNFEDFFIPEREFTPQSSHIKDESTPQSREGGKKSESVKPISRDDIPNSPSLHSANIEVSPTKMCPKCRIYPPCLHMSVSASIDSAKPFKAGYSMSTGQTVTYRSTNSTLVQPEPHGLRSPEAPIKLNVRYRMTNYMVEDPAMVAQLKEEEARKKEMQSIRARLNKITEIENYRKEQFKKELKMLEDNKKAVEDEGKKKIAEDAKKKKMLEEKKKQVDDFKRNKEFHKEIELMRAQEIRIQAESKRKKENDYRKKKLKEYYSKKKTFEAEDDEYNE